MGNPDWVIKKYNRGFSQQFNITQLVSGATGYIPKNLAGYVPTLKVWDQYSGVIISAVCTVVSAAGGQVQYTIQSGAFTIPKSYWFQVDLSTAGGELIDTKTYTVGVEDVPPETTSTPAPISGAIVYVYSQPVNYTVDRDVSTGLYRAWNGATGGVDFNDTLSNVVIGCMNALAVHGGTIYIKNPADVLYLNGSPTIPNNVTIVGVGEVDIEVSFGGVDPFYYGVDSKLENVYLHSDSTYKYVILATDQIQLYDMWTGFPSQGGSQLGLSAPLIIPSSTKIRVNNDYPQTLEVGHNQIDFSNVEIDGLGLNEWSPVTHSFNAVSTGYYLLASQVLIASHHSNVLVEMFMCKVSGGIVTSISGYIFYNGNSISGVAVLQISRDIAIIVDSGAAVVLKGTDLEYLNSGDAIVVDVFATDVSSYTGVTRSEAYFAVTGLR